MEIHIELPFNELNFTDRGNQDVKRLIEATATKKSRKYPVADLWRDDYGIDKDYAMRHISDVPIIITWYSDEEKYDVLDGKHRLYRAKMNGQKEIEAYFFDEVELKDFMM